MKWVQDTTIKFEAVTFKPRVPIIAGGISIGLILLSLIFFRKV